MGSSSPRLVLIEVDRSCAVLLRVPFLIVMCVSWRRRVILSAVVQVSCQLRKHVACGHASVMICVMSLGNIIIGQTRSVCEVRCRRIPRRDTPQGEAKLVCLWWCHVPCGSCVVFAHRGKGKLNVCSFFLHGFDADNWCSLALVRHVYRRSSLCTPTFVSVSASWANDVLPLMVLGSVGCNTMEENNTYRPLCKVLWVCRCVR